MTRSYIYNVVLGEGSIEQTDERSRLDMFSAGSLNSTPEVKPTASEAVDKRLSGRFAGALAELMARELEELAEVSDAKLPLHVVDHNGNPVTTGEEAYYSISDVTVEPPDDRARAGAVGYRADLKRVGTHESHYRVVHFKPTEIFHPWGSNKTAYVGVPASATKRRWLDSVEKTWLHADVDHAVSAEGGDVDMIDTDDAPYASDSVALMYEVEAGGEYPTDPTLWDDYNRAKYQTDADGNEYNSWQHVYDSTHEFDGVPVLDNGLIRLYLDEAVGDIECEEWDDVNQTWTTTVIDLQSWELQDADITQVGLSTLRSQLLFYRDTDTSHYTLDVALHRGWETAQFAVPDNESDDVPTHLEDAFTPIASTSLVDVEAHLDLQRREEVRR